LALNIVLVEPEIPQNTGNIARTCAATGAILHLVGPMGFTITDKHLKRAGLDYWNSVEIHYYSSYQDFLEKNPQSNFYFASTKSPSNYSDIIYPDECYLLFGKETKGLPEDLLKDNINTCIRIPMRGDLRSLNLANSVAVMAYEYYRQKGFKGFETKGKLVNDNG